VIGFAADPEWAARLTSAVLGALWVWPTLWLAREATDENVCWSAGLLVALFPAAVEASTRVLSEATYGLCLVSFLAALARTANRAGLGLAVLSGILGGLSALARPEGMGYLPLAWGVLLAAPWASRAGWTARRVAMATLALTVAWLAIVAPYAALVHKHTGHWHWSGKFGITLAWGESVGEEQPALFIERFLTDRAPEELPGNLLTYAAERPWSILRRLAISLHHLDKYVAPEVLHTGGIVLLALGLLRLRWRGTSGPPEWLLPLALLPSAGVLLFVASPRYFIAILPVVAIVAAIGLKRLRWTAETPDLLRRVSTGHVLLLLVLASLVPWNARHWFRHDSAGVEKAAALWLREAVGPGTVFIGRHPRVSFYAGAREIPLAGRSLAELLAEGRKVGARFLIVDNIHLPGLRPDLLPLMGGDPGRHSQDLALAHIAEDRAGNRVVIYRIQAADGAGWTGGTS
jgi:4-amino-4-deoxy-L-arabinose transferase-like glycosyltransferase